MHPCLALLIVTCLSALLHPYLCLQDSNIIATTYENTMSTKWPHHSSDNEINVRRFIDDVVVEGDGEEDFDDDEEDPDQSESIIIVVISFHLTQSIQHNFLLMTMVTPFMNPITTPTIIPLFSWTMQRKLPRQCGKLKASFNVMYLSTRLTSPKSNLIVCYGSTWWELRSVNSDLRW